MKEIDFFAQSVDHRLSLDTIFFGGGTPSTYPDELLLDTFDKLKGTFDIIDDAEVSIEVNPGTVSPKQLVLWKELGINRLSIGVQSLKDSVLKKLNRMQSEHDVRALLAKASELFQNISVDLILGLPGIDDGEWKALLAQVVAWPLMHVSIYFLTVHEDTRLYFDIEQKKVVLPTDDSLVTLYHWSVSFLKRHGFEQYETSNFARPGYRCRHNFAYWERKSYKGFGLGACSFDGKFRFQNCKNLTSYMERAERGASVVDFAEKLTGEQVYLETIMLGLRRAEGVALEVLFRGLSDDRKARLTENISWLKSRKYLHEKAGRLMLTPIALVVQNEVAVKLSM